MAISTVAETGTAAAPLYLDYNSTTPTDSRVIDAMIPVFGMRFGNPSSAGHATGREATALVSEARGRVSKLVGMSKGDVIFTSGATEANNLAVAGLRKGRGRPIRMLAGATEHKSVLEACRSLADEGSTLNTVPVDSGGTLDLSALGDMLASGHGDGGPGADIVSVMAANSETGVIHPVRDAASIAHSHGALFHCDATQAAGKIPFDAGDLGVDMVTLSAHKMYGPKGCGALVATREARRLLRPVLHGGGQENGMRGGTLNVPGIVGFGVACEISLDEGLRGAPHQAALRDRFEDDLLEAVPRVTVNGKGAERLPNTSNVRIDGVFADAVLANAKGIEIATGSACTSATVEPSHVLLAMGRDRTAADECVRVSFGRPSAEPDVRTAVKELAAAAARLRRIELVASAATAPASGQAASARGSAT